jgi:hypothetical protein
MVQVVENLPSKHEALSSNSVPSNKSINNIFLLKYNYLFKVVFSFLLYLI